MTTSATRQPFGTLSNGEPVESVVLSREDMTVEIITFGAAIRRLCVPDRDGRIDDIAVAYDRLDPYEENPQYFGATIGRYANRIAGASFTLDGQRFDLEANEGGNCLHGGYATFSSRNFEIVAMEEGPEPFVELAYASPDGEGGFPGALQTTVRYSLEEGGELVLDMSAETDRPTVVNLTNHTYFNLAGYAGSRDILDHELTVAASCFLPVDAATLPTGEIRSVDGTIFDFRKGGTFAPGVFEKADEQILLAGGYDHCYVLDKGTTAEPEHAARMVDRVSGRVLDLLTTEPGVQVFSGNAFDGRSAGKDGRALRQSSAFCLEPQRFPDAPNQPQFPSARLDPGEVYRHRSRYRFGVDG